LSALVTHYRNDGSDSKLFVLAIAVSFLLHIGLYYVLPYLQNNAVQPIKRLVVELNMTEQQQEAPQSPAPPPQPEQSKTEPVPQQIVRQQVKPQKPIEETPVLASEAPAMPSDYVMPTTQAPAVATPEPATESKPITNASTTPSDSAPTEQVVANEVSKDEAWDGYGQALYEMVGRNKNYPQMAVRRNWEGQVKVLAKFIMGRLVDVVLIDSSGHEVLDREALSMLRKAVGQLPVRGNLMNKTFTVTVPVDFKLAQQ